MPSRGREAEDGPEREREREREEKEGRDAGKSKRLFMKAELSF